MRIREGFRVQSVGDENIILLQGTYGIDTTKIVSLNETALLLWNLYRDKEFTKDQIASTLIKEFGVREELAVRDASLWIDALVRNGFIEQ
ncbi:PqqD family protein [Dysgonomonas termitidis]|uniref:PqqD family protein n=1 Tax=Dysgonomonas termitidis TaxID=1516126 RepID=A0ABV9KUG8_9BACT